MIEFVLGEDEIRTPAYLAEVYSNLCECGIYSAYWQMALDYLYLISIQDPHYINNMSVRLAVLNLFIEIGRASCRERVCR